MAVTKQVYTAAATWTASQLAGIFRSAFIDAGLMTEWHDSFLSGSVENRVLEVIYNGAKTYGKTYYWFMFTTTGVFIHVATGWNTGSDIPAGPSGAGTQYLDWFATTTNATTNHRQLMAMTASTSTTLTRYTSGVNTAHSWYVLRHAALSLTFRIARPAETLASWIDLDRIVAGEMQIATPAILNTAALCHFHNALPQLRRTLLGSTAMRGATIAGTDYVARVRLSIYGVAGNSSNSTSNWGNMASSTAPTANTLPQGVTILPVAFNNTNTAYSTDKIPVFTGLTVSPYMNTVLPSDFAIIPHFASNTFAYFDTFVVSAGVEEWEVMEFANNAGTTGQASMLFAARTT
jgi:hypothetical protein